MKAKREREITYHRDGTVTYWSVYRQQWCRGVPSDEELAAMGGEEREKVIYHCDYENWSAEDLARAKR